MFQVSRRCYYSSPPADIKNVSHPSLLPSDRAERYQVGHLLRWSVFHRNSRHSRNSIVGRKHCVLDANLMHLLPKQQAMPCKSSMFFFFCKTLSQGCHFPRTSILSSRMRPVNTVVTSLVCFLAWYVLDALHALLFVCWYFQQNNWPTYHLFKKKQTNRSSTSCQCGMHTKWVGFIYSLLFVTASILPKHLEFLPAPSIHGGNASRYLDSNGC